MRYILTGFSHDEGFRVFAFEGIAEDRARTAYRVRADLLLIRKYGIRVQELPLLCRGILERPNDAGEHTFTYTEADMSLFCEDARASKDAAAQKRKARRPPNENAGAAWRGLQL
jgi:hypothetical protein